MTKYDTIGIGYNTHRKADPYLAARLAHHLQLKPNGHYLDVGCGTGNYTVALQQMGGRFTGIDPSARMLEVAQGRSADVEWIQRPAEALEVDPETFDGATAFLTIHHWTDLAGGFTQVNSAIKEGTRFVIFTSTPEQTAGYWLTHYFPRMIEDSARKLPAYDVIVDALQEADFKILETETYDVKPDLQDLFLYAGKFQPERYFDPALRQGISSFSDLAHQEEVDAGLDQLRRDIDSGNIDTIRDRYANTIGDYLYIVTEPNG